MKPNKRATLSYRMQPAIPASVFFWVKSWSQLRRLRKKLKRGQEVRRHTTASRDDYETYDAWEQQMYLTGQQYTTCDGKIQLVPFTRIRAGYIAPVKAATSSSPWAASSLAWAFSSALARWACLRAVSSRSRAAPVPMPK